MGRQNRSYKFGQRLLALRTQAALTQGEVAALIGVHRRTIQNWEISVGYPREQALQRLLGLYLARGVFAPGQEQAEVEALWEEASAHAGRLFAQFDRAWLAGLLADQAPGGAAVELGAAPPGGAAPVRQPPQPIEPAAPVPNNLPRALAAFVGRAAELAAIAGHLRSPGRRLLTIAGVGGVGKTRLALEVAWGVAGEHAQARFPDGVFFVPLAALEAPPQSEEGGADALATAVADALRFALSGSERPYHQLLRFLREQRLLLVLDNLEHLLHLAPMLVHLLEQAPALAILATSRARLDVRGEQVVVLDGLPYPPPDAPAPSGEAYAALKLFQRTAASHAPQLRWSPDELAAAAAICVRVEGVPLAIELAASLVRVLPVQEIAAELAASSAVLQASQRDIPPRHRSLQAVFDHSWRLLAPHEQRVLARLSVFRGGFNRHAARAVASADLLSFAALISQSLLREAASGDDASRYSLHALVREYAADRLLAGDPQAHTALADRHSGYYLTWAAARLPDLRGDRQQAAQAEIHSEIDNIRAAWRWAAGRGDAPGLVGAGRALFHFYEMRSWFQEGAELFQLAASGCEQLAAATRDAAATRAWAQLLARQGWLTFHLGQQERARALLERSLTLLEPLDAPGDLAFTLNYLAAATYHTGDYAEARRLAERALAISAGGGDAHATVIAKTILGQIAYLTGAYAEAQRWSLESLGLERTLGNRWGSVFTLISLGRVAVALKAYDEARRWFADGLAIREAMGDARGAGLCLTYLGDVAAAQGDHQEAERQYQASLARFRRIYNRVGEAVALTKLGAVALATHEPQRAGDLLHRALRTSWAIEALPTTLDALAGLAAVLADGEAARAAEVAAVVLRHPAATEHSRQQALLVQGRLAAEAPPPLEEAPRALAALMERLLGEPAP